MNLDDILEKDWDAQLFGSKEGLVTLLGYISYHTLRSKGSRAGFPDRVLVKDRVIFAELKREKRVSSPVGPEQVMWLDRLAKGGAEVYVWRPSDWDEIGRILGTPGRPPWAPQSMWIAGRGRRDGQ